MCVAVASTGTGFEEYVRIGEVGEKDEGGEDEEWEDDKAAAAASRTRSASCAPLATRIEPAW